MNTYNSDGYILIDLKEADITQSTQHISGLYNRVAEEVAKINKLAIVINAGSLTPLAAVVQKTLNYYVITTSIYIFKINSNDILIIEEAGEVTVDVSIVPTLTEGVKVADFAIGTTEGSLYAPTQQTEINDSTKSDHTTWSSDKIDTLLGNKADTSSLATVAKTGSYTDLSNKPTIPTKVSELQNDSGYVASSSLATVATTGSYSDLSNTPTIPTKVSELQNDSGYITDSALSDYQTKIDNTLVTTDKTVVGAINENKSVIGYSYDEYDDTTTSANAYAVGDLCIRNNTLYKCIAPTYGAWDSSKWESMSIADEIGRIDTALSGKADANTTYTKTQVDNSLALKANLSLLGGFKIQYRNIESNSVVFSPFFTEMCIALCSRGANAIGIASTASANPLVSDSNVTFGLNTQDGYRMSVASNVGAHIKVCFIYY